MKSTAKMIRVGMLVALGLPLAAQAAVEVYGQARASIDYSDNGDNRVVATPAPPGTGADMQKTKMSVSSNASRLGFRGDEDLGGGLTAQWQFESGLDFDTGVFNASQRQTFVGIAGGFGTVLAGKLDTPYKSATNSWDPFVDTKADYNDLMGGNLRTANTLAYMSPDMNGFKGAAAYVLAIANNINDNLPMTKIEDKQDAFSLSGNYTNGPLGVAVGYEVLNKQGALPTGATEKDDATSWKIGGMYTIMDATTLALIYENVDLGGNVKDKNNIYFNVAHKIGATTLKLAYTKADKWSGTGLDETGATQFSVGVSQALTKNTEVYALYSQINNDDKVSLVTAYGFAGGPGSVNKIGNVASDPSVFSFGINHKFSSK